MGFRIAKAGAERRQWPRYSLSDTLSLRYYPAPMQADKPCPCDALILDVSEHGAALITTHAVGEEQNLLFLCPQVSDDPLPAIICHQHPLYESTSLGVRFEDEAAHKFWQLVSSHLNHELG